MYHASFVGVGINLTIPVISMPDISAGDYHMGSTGRTIDGTLITYTSGYKKEPVLNLTNVLVPAMTTLRAAARAHTEITYTLTDELNNSVIDTFTAILEPFNPKFDNFSRVYSASVKVMEV